MSNTPMKPGHYWHRPYEDHEWTMRRVSRWGAGRLFATYDGDWMDIAKIPGEWMPILPPSDEEGKFNSVVEVLKEQNEKLKSALRGCAPVVFKAYSDWWVGMLPTYYTTSRPDDSQVAMDSLRSVAELLVIEEEAVE